MEKAPRTNRCSVVLHPGVACQRTFEDMVTSRQCTGLRKSPHTRRFRTQVQSPSRLLRRSCPGSPSISLMVTEGRHQAALPRCLCDGADVTRASPGCSDPQAHRWAGPHQSANLQFLPSWRPEGNWPDSDNRRQQSGPVQPTSGSFNSEVNAAN